ncbi:hypothetical protein ACWDUM_03940 [Rhodococcus sp. NPDC003322]
MSMRTETGSKVVTRPVAAPVTPQSTRPAARETAASTGPVSAAAPAGTPLRDASGAVPAAGAARVPVKSLVPARSATRTPTRPPVWALVPGSQFAGDRYRLLERCGGSTDIAYWRARDTVLARDVALTVVEFPEADGAAAFFDRTGWLCRIRSDATAAILDMFEIDGRAVIVAQWKQSHALGLVRAGRPADAAAAVVPLARLVRDANGEGALVAIDNPGRVRVDADGVAYLAFPGVPADATARGDVRGLGNVLCELLTGMHHTGDGRPLSPSAVRPDVPAELSELIVRAVGADDVAAGRVVDVLGETVAEAAVVPAVPAAAASEIGAFVAAPAAEPERDRTFWNTWGPFVAGGVLLVVLAVIGWFVGVSVI